MQLRIDADGTIEGLYAEAIDLAALGTLTIRRASYVEPTPDGQWQVDLAPIGGPVLMGFPGRRQALRAEEAWLLEHWLPHPT